MATISDEHFADDPTCVFGPDGTAYFVTKTNTGDAMVPGAASDTDSLHTRRSPDGGSQWLPVTHSIHANDRPFAVTDTTDGPGHGRLYVVFDDHLHGEGSGHRNVDFRHAIALAVSSDGGATFPCSREGSWWTRSADTAAASLAAGLVVLSDGTVADPAAPHAPERGGNATTGKLREVGGWLQSFRTENGAQSLGHAVPVASFVSGYNSPATRGVSAALAVDPGSSRFRDRLYAAWADFGEDVARFA
ncbi:MAG: hypothetical protein U0163_03410 [Gemmatimonadaceae bacterium]